MLVAAGALKTIYLPLFQPFFRPRLMPVLAAEKRVDLEIVRDLAEQGKLRPVIDRAYPLAQIAEAHRYVEAGHKKGNVVVTVARGTNGNI